MTDFDPQLLSKPSVRFVRLGNLTDNGQPNLTATSQPSGKYYGNDLRPQDLPFIKSISPMLTYAGSPAEERGILWTLADLNLVKAIDLDNGLADFDVVPMAIQAFQHTGTDDNGSSYRSTSGVSFYIPAVASLLSAHVDGRRTLAEAIHALEVQLGELGLAEQLAETVGVSLEELSLALRPHALEFVSVLQAAGVLNVEPKDAE